MGFLKFLKRGKKESLDELDLPPEPPPLEGFDENAQNFPEFPDISASEAPQAGEEMPDLDFPKESQYAPATTKKEYAAGFPEFPDISNNDMPEFEDDKETILPIKAPVETHQPSPKSIFPVQEQKLEIDEEQQSPEQPESYSKPERKLFAPRISREMPKGKAVYIRIDSFKATLGSISMARSDLRKSEDALSKLENIKISKDKSLEKIKSSLNDMQKKLIFVDKTLFKGE